MNNLLHIGTDKKAVKATEKAILKILNSNCDQKTMQMALEVFLKSIQPKVNITGCRFNMEEKS